MVGSLNRDSIKAVSNKSAENPNPVQSLIISASSGGAYVGIIQKMVVKQIACTTKNSIMFICSFHRKQ